MNTLSLLTSAIVNKTRIPNGEMVGADLVNADLSHLQADRLNFDSASLVGAKLKAARLGYCSFKGAKLGKADFTNATLRMCVLDTAQVAESCFSNARLEDSTAKGACFTGVDMKGAKLTETSFERAVLQKAVLDGAEGDNINFRGADLSCAKLTGARFIDADFRGADLRGADLSKGCFRGADFRGALLDGALFTDADCSSAMFDADKGPAATVSGEEKSGTTDEPARILSAFFGENLTKLPEVFADNKEFIQEMTGRLQQASQTLKNTAKHSPEEWKEWTEKLLASAKDEEAFTLETFIGFLYNIPFETQEQAISGAVSKEEILDRLQAMYKLLNTTVNELPEEWKPVLEPLVKEMKSGEGIDFKYIVKLFSNWPKDISPK